MKDILKKSRDLAKELCNLLDDLWMTVKKTELESSNGRGENALPYTKKGSFLYVVYNKNDEVLYVGETRVSVRRRFLWDGSGAHKNEGWYEQMTYLKYIKMDEEELPTKIRRMIEQALSVKLNPKNYK